MLSIAGIDLIPTTTSPPASHPAVPHFQIPSRETRSPHDPITVSNGSTLPRTATPSGVPKPPSPAPPILRVPQSCEGAAPADSPGEAHDLSRAVSSARTASSMGRGSEQDGDYRRQLLTPPAKNCPKR